MQVLLRVLFLMAICVMQGCGGDDGTKDKKFKTGNQPDKKFKTGSQPDNNSKTNTKPGKTQESTEVNESSGGDSGS